MTRISLIVVASVALIMFAVGAIYGGGLRFGFTEPPRVPCTLVIGVVGGSKNSSPYPVPEQVKGTIPMLECAGQYIPVGPFQANKTKAY